MKKNNVITELKMRVSLLEAALEKEDEMTSLYARDVASIAEFIAESEVLETLD